MRRAQYAVNGAIDAGAFGLSVVAPKDEHDRRVFTIDAIDDSIGESFPTFAAMRIGASAADGQNGIEEQNALPRPRRQIAVRRNGTADIVMKLFVYVDKRRGGRRRTRNRKAQAVRLILAVIRILSQNDGFRFAMRRQLERVENIAHVGKDFLRSVFGNQKLAQPAVRFASEGVGQKIAPVILKDF